MNDTSLIDKINWTFVPLTAAVILICLSAWNTGEFWIQSEFGPKGGTHYKCDTRNINHMVDTAWADEFHSLNIDFCTSSPEVEPKKIENIRSMICSRMNSTAMITTMAQPHNDKGTPDQDFLHHLLEELMEQPINSFHCVSIFVAATKASISFTAVLPMYGPAITSSSQYVPHCKSYSKSNCKSKSNNIRNITNITSIENTGLVDGSTIVAPAMSLGG